MAIDGRTLLGRAVGTLREVCDDVRIAMPEERPLPRAAWIGMTAAWDAPGGEGPLAGVLGALSGPAWEQALVLGVDMPLASPAMLRALLAALEDRVAVVPAPGGRLQPLLAAYSRRAFFQLASAFDRGERSIVAAVRLLDPLVLDDAALARLPDGIASCFNVNTPADLAEASRRLRRREAE